MVDPKRKLVGIGSAFGRGCVSTFVVRAGRKIGERVTCQDGGDKGIHRHQQGVSGVGGCVQPQTLGSGGNGHHLGAAKNLAKALVLSKVKGPLAAIVDFGNKHRSAIGKSELVAAERRNSAWISRGGMVKVIASIESRVAHEFEH